MFSFGLITTNHPKRFEILHKTVSSVEKHLESSVSKVMSVDEFPDIETDFKYFQKYKDLGWKVCFKKHTGRNSMVTNQLNLLENSPQNLEWILYCEDDVTFKNIPSNKTISKILTENTGFVSLNAHVHEFPTNETIEFCNNEQNYIQVDNYSLLNKNKEIFQKKWYFNFPSCYVRKKHLKSILEYASKNYSGSNYSIEEGLSYSWFEIFKNHNYKNWALLSGCPTGDDTLKEIHRLAVLNYWDNCPETQVEPVNQKSSMWF